MRRRHPKKVRTRPSLDHSAWLLETLRNLDCAKRDHRNVSHHLNHADPLVADTDQPVAQSFPGRICRNLEDCWPLPVSLNQPATALRSSLEEAGNTHSGSDMFGQAEPAPGGIAKLAHERIITDGQDPRDRPDLLARAAERLGERPRADRESGVQSNLPPAPAEARGQGTGTGRAGAGQRSVNEGPPATPQPEPAVFPPNQSNVAPEPAAPSVLVAATESRADDASNRLRRPEALVTDAAIAIGAMAKQLPDNIALKVRKPL